MTRKDIEDYFRDTAGTLRQIYDLLLQLDIDVQATQYIVDVIRDNYERKCTWLSGEYDRLPED